VIDWKVCTASQCHLLSLGDSPVLTAVATG
jgi:hypothetical protein